MLYTYFPYYRLGFRANPFRVLDDDEWAEVAVLAPAVLAAASGASHLQLRAGRGRGKTSALLGLGAHFRRQGLRAAYEYLPPGETAWHTPPAGLDVLLLDEADRLRPRELRRLLDAAAAGTRLALGAHADLAPAFARRGLRLESVMLDDLGAEHLPAVLARRLSYFRLEGTAPGVRLADDVVPYLRARLGSDLRAMERLLYLAFQQRLAAGEIDAAELEKIGDSEASGAG